MEASPTWGVVYGVSSTYYSMALMLNEEALQAPTDGMNPYPRGKSRQPGRELSNTPQPDQHMKQRLSRPLSRAAGPLARGDAGAGRSRPARGVRRAGAR